MKKLIFNSKGEAIDESTGQVIGKRDSSGKLILNPQQPKEETPAKPEQPTPPPTSPTTIPAPSIASPQKEEIKKEEEKKGPTVSIPVPPSYTKYEIRPDSEFTIKFCLKFDGDLISVYREDAYLKFEKMEKHWVKFRMWNYKEEISWKNQTMEFDSSARFFKQNTNKLNELKLRNLIKDWSFAEIDPKFKLLHVNGVLSDESYSILMGMHPAILDHIVFLMNSVLE